MRPSKIVRVGLFLALAAGPSLAETGQYDWRSWGSVVDTLETVRRGKRVGLSSPFILAGSERVVVDSLELAPQDYEINYQRGLLRIKTLLDEDAVVVVSYTRLPFLLNSVYSLRPIEFAAGDDVIPAPRIETRQTQPLFNPAGNLVFGGVKSISFSVGSNRSASLDQTLRATVEGDLTSTIHVKALLSDNNLPIQPEGNTQELEYLDKVYVEFTGPRAGATLGDFAFANNFSDFNAFRRELKGAAGRVDVGDRTRVELAGGSSKGVFRTVSFRGTDQLQGPYELLSQGRIVGEVVIAGTEKVYFNGALLLRGQNRDYTIDYDRGTITFTPKRPVTDDTEIAVDFEVTQEQYDRTSVFGSTRTEAVPGGFTLSVLAARERDDFDRPKSVTLDEDDKRLLAEAGDDETQAIASGVTFVGEGKGEYVLIPADTIGGEPEHFEYDDTLGAYVLAFVEVGPGAGEYILDGVSVRGSPIYRFVGGEGGNFVIGKKLPLPQSHTVYTTRLKKESDHLDFDLQYNVSDFDANTLSPLGDTDNVGDAGEIRLGIKKIPALVGTIDLVGSVSTIEDHFKGLEKTRTWYFYRDWNLEREVQRGREIIEELISTFSRADKVKLDYSLGRIKRDNFDGIKQEVRTTIAASEDRRLTGRAFDTDVKGDDSQRTRRHGTVSASYGFWKLLPSVEYGQEEFLVSSTVHPDSGIAYDRYLVRLGSRRDGRFSFSVHGEERFTEELADSTLGWVDTRRDFTLGGLVASRGLRAVQGEIQYTHRVQDDRRFGGSQTSDLARLKGLFRLDRIGVNSNLDYEISQNQSRIQQKTVVFVGEGQGDYNKLGEPVGKGRGDYTLVFLPTTETVPTQRVDFTWNLSWKLPTPKNGDGLISWLGSNVSLNQSLSVKEETTFDKAYKVYLLFPSALQRDESTLSGVVSLRQEWLLLGANPKLSLTFRYQRDDEEENRFNDINEERFFEQQILRVDRSLTKVVSANVELRREVRRRDGAGLTAGTGSTYDVRGRAIAAGWGLRFSAGSSLDGEVELRQQKDRESKAEEIALAFKPRLVWRLSKAVNLFATYEITRFSTPVEADVKPFFYSNPGTTHRWGLTPNLRLSRIISVLATYKGRSEETFLGKRILDHEFTLETRAFF
ncbi:MAG: hypothetical protein JSW58_10445 [Candidatus Latescibacterota bacterium]|nr:MAG: hypothetical protein JSW58_10445 [Candidatus Latescibacterota bacterium]